MKASITSYVWIHHMTVEPFPVMPYLDAIKKMLAYVHSVSGKYSQIPYYPNATMGWDASPRTVQSDKFENTGYPFMGTLGDNTPANFRRALEELKGWLETRPPEQRILTINAWNEWTEGSYLEPDTRHGLGYLEAIRTVFGVAGAKTDRWGPVVTRRPHPETTSAFAQAATFSLRCVKVHETTPR